MFLVLKRKILIISLCILILLVSVISVTAVKVSSTPKANYTIVIDAGHGGIDPGCEGNLENSNERILNLEYAKTLKSYLTLYGFHVVMTRINTDGLYSALATNKKKDDMQKRKEIIEKSNADLVISIHMNSYSLKSVRGAQAFYNPENEISKNLANSIQEQFLKDLPKAKKTSSVGDYYILNCTNIPAVIIECGFLSNYEEEKLLLSSEYKDKVCYSILCGVLKYLN